MENKHSPVGPEKSVDGRTASQLYDNVVDNALASHMVDRLMAVRGW